MGIRDSFRSKRAKVIPIKPFFDLKDEDFEAVDPEAWRNVVLLVKAPDVRIRDIVSKANEFVSVTGTDRFAQRVNFGRFVDALVDDIIQGIKKGTNQVDDPLSPDIQYEAITDEHGEEVGYDEEMQEILTDALTSEQALTLAVVNAYTDVLHQAYKKKSKKQKPSRKRS